MNWSRRILVPTVEELKELKMVKKRFIVTIYIFRSVAIIFCYRYYYHMIKKITFVHMIKKIKSTSTILNSRGPLNKKKKTFKYFQSVK